MKKSRRKKIVIATLSAFFLLVPGYYVASRLRWPSQGEFQGTLTYAFEIHDFQPDKSFEHWWLNGNKVLNEIIYKDLSERKTNWKIENPRYRIKLYGRLSPIGEHGHFGMWRRSLTVERVIECEYIGTKPL